MKNLQEQINKINKNQFEGSDDRKKGYKEQANLIQVSSMTKLRLIVKMDLKRLKNLKSQIVKIIKKK